MPQRIFLAGASGVIGQNLIPRLVKRGHIVIGTTRSREKMDVVRAAGAEPVLVDVFDRAALISAVAAARPDVIVHQLTDLPDALEPALMAEHLVRNARIRAEGTRNLVGAALAASTERVIAQSIAWAYTPGPEPHCEDDPLDVAATGARAVSVGGVAALETAVLHSPPLVGVVLRYGALYGSGTGTDTPRSDIASLHVDDAAEATAIAVDSSERGIFNIASPNPWVTTGRAERDLPWVSRRSSAHPSPGIS